MTPLNVQLLLTGNELMAGDIIDSNSAMLAQQLKPLGLNISRKVTVSDNPVDLENEISHMSKLADILIINGGLGPTVDDLTSEVLAKVSKCSLVENREAILHLEQWAQRKSITLNKPNLKQALLPENAAIIFNRIGSAVGINLSLNNCEIYCTPGVPKELNIMFEEEIIPHIKKTFSQQLVQQSFNHVSRLHTFGVGESGLQELIFKAIPNWSEDIELGFRAAPPIVEVKLATTKQSALELKSTYIESIKKTLDAHIIDAISERPKPFAAYIVELLKSKNKSITAAESCTGGLIASKLTAISGSSEIFEAGFVTYSNKMKSQIIGVPNETLERYGAVSKETVIAMAEGALKTAKADYTIAVSGIAGPTGGTSEKPVGSVWIAWGDANEIKTKYFCISGTRTYFQETVAFRALDLIRRFILETTKKPFYIK